MVAVRLLMLGYCAACALPTCAQDRQASPVRVPVDARAILLADHAASVGSSVRYADQAGIAGEAVQFELADLPHVRPDFSLPALPAPRQEWRLAAPAFHVMRSEASATDRMALAGITGHRRHRATALDARLVLRIDGREESEPLSLGGGVARAIWTAMRE